MPECPRNLMAVLIATAGGVGFLPGMPGTAGAAVGVGIYLAIVVSDTFWLYLPVLTGLTIAGVWAANSVEELWGHDASRIVIDEVVGQLIALGFVTRIGTVNLVTGAILGFLLFRFFDILKPFPIRRLELLPGGVGVMADDIGAGIFALGVLILAEPILTGIL